MRSNDSRRSAGRERWRPVVLAATVPAVLLTPPCFALVTLLDRDPAPGPLAAALAWLGLQLLVVALGVGLCARWAGRDRSVDELLDDLAVRAAAAEGELRRAEETLLELRSTVAGLGHASRLLTTRQTDLSAGDRHRLQRLYDAELDRLERRLSDRPGPGAR